MSGLRFLLVLTCFLVCSMRAQAAPSPIVFDFEDGLQGWELRQAPIQFIHFPSSAQRVQTQVLGGEWAIFGDGRRFEGHGPTAISIDADLTGIASISLEQFFLDGEEDGLFLAVITECNVDFCTGLSRFFEIVEPGSPSLRAVDVRDVGENLGIEIVWSNLRTAPASSALVAFIDNITFHPVPEPSTLGLVVLSLFTLVMARCRIG